MSDKKKVVDVPQGDIHVYDDIMPYFNSDPVIQNTKKQYQSVTFVTTGIIAFDGGQTTMLHLGTALSKQGYQVYYLSYVEQPVEEMEENAAFNCPGYQGTCLGIHDLERHQSDIWIATLWESAYVIKNFKGYKMYFVQDYEPYFYAYGDRYQLAKKTYELGLHMVSLGPWCADLIEKNCVVNSPLESINFPVDSSTYPFQERDFSQYLDKKKIKLAVYTKWVSPRRAPIYIQMVLNNSQRLLKKKGIELEISYFGSDGQYQFINGRNLGKLNHSQLLQLYRDNDFGIAPSMTNFSLVTFEMMSAGLPVIDFAEGSGPWFMSKDTYISTHLDEYQLSAAIEKAIASPSRLQKMTQDARNYLQRITWQKTIDDFIAVLANL